MRADEWISVDAENVLAEVIDNEVMIIDMRLGNYFSLSGVAATIWNALGQPRRLEELVEVVGREYSGADEEIAAAVERFVGELAAEKLVTHATNGHHTPPPAAEPKLTKSSFQAPVLEKYTDMQALLLVDPIHDVDVLGWPRVKPS